MEKLTKEGINSFKFFLAYKGAMAVTDQQLLNGLRRSKELGALPMVWPFHCQRSTQWRQSYPPHTICMLLALNLPASSGRINTTHTHV